ncbi:hypothetical protein Cob_v002092 [Colletotrichum orbiculare MAFF 240422]|uniref:Uncharacterized protein n=1 Tax=Colletotrichum orbiculare (strain 104-T / ATCC 96160 / CBS 514.97 / LARS 414 / MAFF 240422) TaxID=1213857 RepID=A0A484G4D2_COLOR|nr:hypothetical protein Cob_v002092 [Colletotrichum orbiculare MAFF 240422]
MWKAPRSLLAARYTAYRTSRRPCVVGKPRQTITRYYRLQCLVPRLSSRAIPDKPPKTGGHTPEPLPGRPIDLSHCLSPYEQGLACDKPAPFDD